MYVLLSTQPLTFAFGDSATSTRDISHTIYPPAGSEILSIFLQDYNFAYADGKQYGFGEMGVNLSTVLEENVWKGVCVATLKDDNRDERRWNANIVGVIHYYGRLPQ